MAEQFINVKVNTSQAKKNFDEINSTLETQQDLVIYIQR